MKTISTLIILSLVVLLVKADPVYNVTSNRGWYNGGASSIPATCANCTINISTGVTLTMDQSIICQNCTFSGGNISMNNINMALQTNSGRSTYFTNTHLVAAGTSTITGSAPIYISGSTLTFYNTARFNPQQLLDVTGSALNFYDNSFFLATGGPVNLRTNSTLTAGNGVLGSNAYLFFNGPTLNIYDNSSVILGNYNNYYFNWSSYNSKANNKSYNTQGSTLNCGGSYPHACASPYVYGAAVLNSGGASQIASLPVLLSAFSARGLSNNTNEVSWTTSQEANADHFTIERSADGTQWKAIGAVAAKGNSSLTVNYTFIDLSPLESTNNYRLAMTDKDGTVHYSEIKSVHSSVVNNISIFPNPTHDYVNVSLVKTPAETTIRLVNANGQLMQQRIVAKGTSGVVSLPVHNYVPGAYTVQVVSAGSSIKSSLVLINP